MNKEAESMNKLKRILVNVLAAAAVMWAWSAPASATVYATADVQWSGGAVVGTCTSVSTSPNDELVYATWWIYCTMQSSAGFSDGKAGGSAFYGGYNESVQLIDYSPVSSSYTVNGSHTWYAWPGYSNGYDSSWASEYCTIYSSTSGTCS
jgi:hypothetical protein